MNAQPAAPIAVHETHPAARQVPAIAAVEAYWRAVGGGGVPVKRAFDLMMIYPQAPYLLMAERIDAQPRSEGTYRFVYCGTFIAENFPFDLTGRVFGPDTPRISKIPWPGFFDGVLNTPSLQFGRQALDWPNRDYGDIDYGIVPLADDAGLAKFALACLIFADKPWPR